MSRGIGSKDKNGLPFDNIVLSKVVAGAHAEFFPKQSAEIIGIFNADLSAHFGDIQRRGLQDQTPMEFLIEDDGRLCCSNLALEKFLLLKAQYL